MRLQKKLKTQVDIEDYYAVKVRVIWRDLKQGENASFFWLCIYLFLEYIRPATLYPVIDILPWTQISLIFATFTALSDRKIKWVKNPANIFMFLFLFVVLLSCVFAFSFSKALDAIDIPILWLLAYLLIVNIVNTEKRLIVFLLLFMLINFKMSQHGFVSFASRGFAYTKWGVTGSPGWFRDSGDFGTAMTIFVPLVISFILALRHKWGKYKKWFFYFVAMTGLVTIIATSSRGAQLAIVGVVIWFLLKSRQGFKNLIFAVLIGGAIFSVLPEKMIAEYQGAGEDSTSENRLAHWAFGLSVVRDKPLLGVGYNNWLYYCNYRNPYGLVDDYRGRCLEPHNTYIEALAELGIAGTIIYICLIIYIFRLNYLTRKLVGEKDEKLAFYLSHGLDGGLVGYLISSVFFTVLFYPFFWVQLAMVVALHQVTKNGLKNEAKLIRP